MFSEHTPTKQSNTNTKIQNELNALSLYSWFLYRQLTGDTTYQWYVLTWEFKIMLIENIIMVMLMKIRDNLHGYAHEHIKVLVTHLCMAKYIGIFRY